MKRKIIQIAAGLEWHGASRIVALCNDGTLWISDPSGWLSHVDVPQPATTKAAK